MTLPTFSLSLERESRLLHEEREEVCRLTRQGLLPPMEDKDQCWWKPALDEEW